MFLPSIVKSTISSVKFSNITRYGTFTCVLSLPFFGAVRRLKGCTAVFKPACHTSIPSDRYPSVHRLLRGCLPADILLRAEFRIRGSGRDRKARVCPEIFYNHRGEKLILLVQQGDDLFVLNFQFPQRIVHDLHLQLHLRI